MRRKVAIYGKGGIGKSTISANLSAALSESGIRVLQIGCDPKHDSTRLLTDGDPQNTVLQYLKDVKPDDRKLGDIVIPGYGNTLCVEAGGPEPGIGCAGRGIISAFDLLSDLGMESLDYDMVLYDVLGDVVCGGFAVPIRNEYADTIYIVTSGEFMSIYAANNILRGVSNYNPDRIGGIIFNSRGDEFEDERVKTFSDAIGIPIVARIGRSTLFAQAEKECKTVMEMYPASEIASIFRDLAKTVTEGKRYRARPLPENMLEKIVLGRERAADAPVARRPSVDTVERPKIYASRSVNKDEILYGCAFSGACSAAVSVKGLTTVVHSTRNCSQFAFQLISNSCRRSMRLGRAPVGSFVDPDVVCTDMDESSTIFGGTDRLRETLEKEIDVGRKDIAVITSCAPGIIGDDVKGVIDTISSEHPDVRIVYIKEDGNLKGDHMQGLIDACIEITKSLAVKDLPKKDIVNLVGVKPMATNITDNLSLISDLLSKIDVGIGCTFMGNCTVDSIKNMTSAELSILVTKDQFATMQKAFLEDSYGMRFSNCIIGTGLYSTEEWLREVAKEFSKESAAESLISELEKEYSMRCEPLKKVMSGKTAYIASMHMDVDWLIDMANDIGMKIIRKVVVKRPDHTLDSDMKVRHKDVEVMEVEDMDDVKRDVVSKHPDFFFSTYVSDIGCDDISLIKIPIVPDIGPFAGLDMMTRWIRRSKAPRSEGWRKDVL